jgi:hypothetical protein
VIAFDDAALEHIAERVAIRVAERLKASRRRHTRRRVPTSRSRRSPRRWASPTATCGGSLVWGTSLEPFALAASGEHVGSMWRAHSVRVSNGPATPA